MKYINLYFLFFFVTIWFRVFTAVTPLPESLSAVIVGRREMFNDHRKHQNGGPYMDPRQSVIAAEPLNSVPYVGPSLASNGTHFLTKEMKNEGLAMVFFPSRPPAEDTKNILSASNGGVILNGTAALGKIGPLVGSLDIGESEEGYLFCVSLLGVSTDKDRFSCEIEANGKVVVKGATTTGERIVRKHSQVFEMQTQNLCPPGEFSVTFMLPGPVDNQTFVGSFCQDGILVGKIKKREAKVL